MKAAVVDGVRKISVKEVSVPKISENEVLVEIKAGTICNSTDWAIIEGKYPVSLPYPFILGHEASGRVHKVGKLVKGITVDDRVAIATEPPVGGFAEYCAIDPTFVCGIPDELSYEEASIIEMLTCAFSLVWKCIKLGDVVAIIGQGAAGLLNLQCARVMGADKIIVSDFIEKRRALAKEFGADVIVDPRNESIETVVKKETKGKGVDVAIEASGSTEAFKQCMKIIKYGGTLGQFGVVSSPVEITPAHFHYNAIRLIPGGPYEPWPLFMRRSVRLVETGKVTLKSLITHRYPLTKITEALNLIKERPEEVLKVVVYPKNYSEISST